MDRSRWGKWLSYALLGVLVLASIYLALNRIYQVDEAQNLFTARILGNGDSARYANHAPLFLLGPLAHLARRAVSSVALFTQARLIFLGVFWVNTLLLALNLTDDLRSRGGLLALLAAATLAPLWDYGFEIRHDNLLLTGLLLAWWLVRREGIPGVWATFGMGFLTVLLQFTAFKSFLYFLPLSAALLVFQPSGWRGRRALQLIGWVGGGLLAFVLARMAYASAGAWEIHLAAFKQGFVVSNQVERFPPWETLARLTRESPLVTTAALGGLLAWINGTRQAWRHGFTWSGPLPELLLAAGTLGVLLINPTPFPYNLVLVAPFFLLTFRAWWPDLESALDHRQAALPWLAALIVVVHGLPFIIYTTRHFDWNNDRQQQLMEVAERLTDPSTDSVYDGIGLVPTRASIGYHWYLHSLNMKNYESGKWPSVARMLTDCPAPILLVSYRMDWLSKLDRDHIAAHYIPLADDCWVLGGSLPLGGGEWVCLHPGRYLVTLDGSASAGIAGLKVDGIQVGKAPMSLTAGSHRIDSPPGAKAWVVWTGPHEVKPPRLAPSDHRQLFVNWY